MEFFDHQKKRYFQKNIFFNIIFDKTWNLQKASEKVLIFFSGTIFFDDENFLFGDWFLYSYFVIDFVSEVGD